MENRGDVKNVVQLGAGFLLLFSAFQSCSNIQEFVIQSISKRTTHSIDAHAGYYSLAIIYGVLTIFNFVAPLAVLKISSKWCMVIGSLTYVLFLASFLYLTNWLFYSCSILLGIGAAFIWVGQGSYLTENSNEETLSRNSGIFWALLQCSLPVGGLFVYSQVKNEGQDASMSEATISFIYICFTILAGFGSVVLLFLRKSNITTLETNRGEQTAMLGPASATPSSNEELVISAEHLSQQVDSVLRLPLENKGFFTTLVEHLGVILKLARTGPMLLLALVFIYTGFELTFWSGIYGTSVANTLLFTTPSKQLLALNIISVGFGEILGGGLFGICASRFNKIGRNPVILMATVVHLATFFLILLNLPADAPAQATKNVAYMQPNEYLALLCGFLLGFGDACWNTQIYSLLGSLYATNSAPAFGLFKFFQSGAACLAFFFGAHILLHWQLLALAILAPVAAVAFFDVEWKGQSIIAASHEKHP